MRKTILLALCLTALWGSVQAQNKKAANAIFAKILFVDYGNPNSIDNLDITNGIEIGYIRNINRWLNFGIPLKIGLANVADDSNNNRIFAGADGVLQLQFARTEDTRIIPYVMGGGGLVWEKDLGRSSDLSPKMKKKMVNMPIFVVNKNNKHGAAHHHYKDTFIRRKRIV